MFHLDPNCLAQTRPAPSPNRAPPSQAQREKPPPTSRWIFRLLDEPEMRRGGRIRRKPRPEARLEDRFQALAGLALAVCFFRFR